MNTYKVTVITPCHNSTQYIEECWNSIKNQTISTRNVQVIFVDDASTDNGETIRMIESLTSDWSGQVDLIKLRENHRQGGARNMALKIAKGDYIQFLDSDDTLSEDSLEELYELAVKYDVDLIQYGVNPFGEDRLIEIDSVEKRKWFLSSIPFSCGHNRKFYKRCFVESVGSRFAENMIFEEPLFTYPLFLYFNKALYLKKDYYHFRSHQDSTMAYEAKDRLMDHPRVQLLLLEFLRERRKLFKIYKEEIEDYFIWTFFYETVVNASKIGLDSITEEDVSWLKDTCLMNFPNWRDNKYISSYSESDRIILSMIDE